MSEDKFNDFTQDENENFNELGENPENEQNEIQEGSNIEENIENEQAEINEEQNTEDILNEFQEESTEEENYQDLADNYYNEQEKSDEYQNVQNYEEYHKYENYYLDEDREFDYRSYMSLPRESQEDVIPSDYRKEEEQPKKKEKKKSGNGKIILISVISSLLVCGIFAFLLIGVMLYIADENFKNIEPAFKTYKNITIEERSSELISEVAEKAGPSVVGIKATVLTRDFFFGITESNPEGSGIIFRENGYILTNNHVVESALDTNTNNLSEGCKIEVILPTKNDGKYETYEATVVGRDTKTDLAVLKIDAHGLPTATFANSDKVRVGEVAVAIGNPGGIEYMGSVTAGIVSGLNRTVEIGNGKQIKLIQTDAAINPGNSGGALVNAKGEVMGVNTVKIAGSVYEGLGFAIPSNIVKQVVENLVEFNYVKGRPSLGVRIDVRYTEEVAKKYRLPVGVYVGSVDLLSAAERAGIEKGDIITEFGGVKVKTYEDLVEEKNKYAAGDEVVVKVYKIEQEKTVKLKMKLGEDLGTVS